MKSHKTTNCLILILSSFVLMNFQCSDCDDELHDRSNFSATLSTLQNTFEVGDTLILSSSFSSQIKLEFSETTHDNANQLINFTLEVFEGIENDKDAIQARDNFEFIDLKGNVFIPQARTWEISISNTCDENLCELEFGLIPQKAGYYGFLLGIGSFGFADECQFLNLIPTKIESNGNNNFEIFNEINLTNIRTDGAFFANPESEDLLYFIKVIE